MPSGGELGTKATLSLRDAGNEAASFQVWGAVLTAANFAAQRTAWLDLVTAAMALVLGAQAGEDYGIQTQELWVQPTNGAARELALKVSYRDNIMGQRFTASLPTLNPTAINYVINSQAKDVVQMAAPAGVVTFITTFEAFAVNPFNGNPCQVLGLRVARGGK